MVKKRSKDRVFFYKNTFLLAEFSISKIGGYPPPLLNGNLFCNVSLAEKVDPHTPLRKKNLLSTFWWVWLGQNFHICLRSGPTGLTPPPPPPYGQPDRKLFVFCLMTSLRGQADRKGGGESAPSALTVGKCKILSHLLKFDSLILKTHYISLWGDLKNAFFMPFTPPLNWSPTILRQSSSKQQEEIGDSRSWMKMTFLV